MERRRPARVAWPAAVARWRRTRPARAVARFGAAGGAVLTGGIAYSALFSVFAALTIGYAALTAVLGSHGPLRRDVLDTLATWLPGVLAVGGRGLITPADLALSVPLSVTGLVAVVVLVFSATGAMAALRTAVRAMFDEPAGAAMAGRLRDLAGLAGMAGAMFVSAVLGAVVTAVAAALALPDASVVARVAGVAVVFAVDAGTFALVVVVLAGVRPPGRDLARGALLAAAGIGVIRVLGTGVVAGGAGANRLYGSFAAVVTLLVWVNLITRVVLLAAAWTADPPATGPPAHPGSAGP